tara:strand:+ start:2007 stop:2171 length:165 start_codon:yes stop_codon:yes gene_type:complete
VFWEPSGADEAILFFAGYWVRANMEIASGQQEMKIARPAWNARKPSAGAPRQSD